MAARPATRRLSDRPRDAAPDRPPVRDFTTPQDHVIEWDVRPVYDFLFSLSGEAGSTDDIPESDRSWLADARAALPPDLAAPAGRLFDTEVSIHLAAIVVAQPGIRVARDLVEFVTAASPRSVIEAIFAEATRDPKVGMLVSDALDGGAGALEALGEALPDWHRPERLDMLRQPVETHRDIVAVLTGWAVRYTEIEDRIEGILARDYESRAGDRATLTGSDLIEKTTGGVRWTAEPGIRRVILAPSYFSRPYNFLLAADDWRFFGYPVLDEALDLVDPLAPPLSVIRLHRALGDATRLRILKLLASKDLYLTEIAQHLELSKPTIKHHLAQLRIAGLVTVTETGNLIYYSLRRSRLEDASIDLKSFLTD